jgi:putative SOS response-associated peptidase YedK
MRVIEAAMVHATQHKRQEAVGEAKADQQCARGQARRRLRRPSFLARRCLIPLEAFAEAQGQAGAKTRTWFSLPGQPIFAAAGLWRSTAEWGACFTMVMTEGCVDMGGNHDRMPVILAPENHAAWLTA